VFRERTTHPGTQKRIGLSARVGEILVGLSKSVPLMLQVGNQQHSSVVTGEVIAKIHGGAIGNAYEARTWYTNQRGSIGLGKETAHPDLLDWDLWQGPAPDVLFVIT